MVLSGIFSESPLHFGLVISSLAENGVTLLGANEELVGMGLSVVTDASSTIGLTIGLVSIAEDQLIERGTQVTHIPPQNTAVG